MQSLAAGHMAGTIQIPGHTALATECPPDLMEAEPGPPKLNLMKARSDLFPEVPAALVTQWASHELGSELQKFLNQIHEEFGPTPELRTDSAADAGGNDGGQGQPTGGTGAGGTGTGGTGSGGTGTTGRKRKGQNSASTGKRTKVDRTKVVPTTEAQLLFDVDLVLVCSLLRFSRLQHFGFPNLSQIYFLSFSQGCEGGHRQAVQLPDVEQGKPGVDPCQDRKPPLLGEPVRGRPVVECRDGVGCLWSWQVPAPSAGCEW